MGSSGSPGSQAINISCRAGKAGRNISEKAKVGTLATFNGRGPELQIASSMNSVRIPWIPLLKVAEREDAVQDVSDIAIAKRYISLLSAIHESLLSQPLIIHSSSLSTYARFN